ncbi:LLM class flavin-dependent oxidoreductase [Rathayibacter tanaceti]|uniref:Alkanesulfonate monooxygenase n=2 Tax=Rathayibacter tanaceti TaxID=1671680 RepID=A0A162GNS1_9MICO|nr:LLM class flavin-dependent oxidoreductase [Rathayibacter tanaceti]KZX20508.1 Alkanesulfonate monooxygenase [Rathayibacter tanaceti]QHC56753.1 LLM class flavin-dependent oxidoreductase [Rathayibacter tanaceti]TCO33725.1 alkanesulfonate monooxygenase [Rathayibacter tanaceti]
MPIVFLGIAALNDGSETRARSGASFDPEYTLRLAAAHEDSGWDRILFAYHSGAPDPAITAAFIASRLERIQLLLAHRPNVSYPTVAAKAFATLDQLSGGRLSVHFITGGSDADQAAEGDFLTKDERYARTAEYIRIVKKVWSSPEPFDHEGDHYRFTGFVSDIPPAQQPRPQISFGGSSPAALAVGAAESDIYALWGEPLRNTAEQIRSVTEASAAAGRADRPRIQVAFRPILGATEEQAWEKAESILGRIQARTRELAPAGLTAPENTGSQRLLSIAAEGDRFDRALWTKAGAAAGARGNSNALVGTPETVAAALLDYVDLGVDIISARGYDYIDDTLDFGRHVIPLVREEVARRDAAAASVSAEAAHAGV